MIGIASRLPRERQSAEPPEMIPMAPSGLLTLVAGTLAYMAPEQTGRMNRSIDYRSDLYSLGVSFYQMLTGLSIGVDWPVQRSGLRYGRDSVSSESRTDIHSSPFYR
jgi:serine/threonine protein kinase